MKNFINLQNNKQIDFNVNDLPMIIHGREHTGSSLFSVTMAVHLYRQNNKILMFTAYPMAKDEFLEQIDNKDTVFYLEDVQDIKKAQGFQTIIIKSGDKDLCAQVLLNLPDINDRILFIKNVDIILNNDIIKNINQEKILLSGDADLSMHKDFIKKFTYKTKIFFSESELLKEDLLPLERYQACVFRDNDRFIIKLD